jgi:hypothetical protein
MTIKRFTPKKGQLFFYIREIEVDGIPDLEITSTKCDLVKHKKIIEKGNCFLTQEDAYNNLYGS